VSVPPSWSASSCPRSAGEEGRGEKDSGKKAAAKKRCEEGSGQKVTQK